MLQRRAAASSYRGSDYDSQPLELKDHRKFAKLQDIATNLGLWDGRQVTCSVRGILTLLIISWLTFGILYMGAGSNPWEDDTNPPYAPSKVDYGGYGSDSDATSDADESGNPIPNVYDPDDKKDAMADADNHDEDEKPVGFASSSNQGKRTQFKRRKKKRSKVSIMRQRAIMLARKAFSAEVDELKARIEAVVHGHQKDIYEDDTKLIGLENEISHMAEEWEHNMLSIQKLPRKIRVKHRQLWNVLGRHFYRVSSSLYQVTNRRALHFGKDKVPLLSMNSHQYVPRYWAKARLRGVDLPKNLIHFGSHADMNHVDVPGKIIEAIKSLRVLEPRDASQPPPPKAQTTAFLKTIGEQTSPENAGTLGPYSFDFKTVTWVKPKWVGTPVSVSVPLKVGKAVLGKPAEGETEEDTTLLCYTLEMTGRNYRENFIRRAFQSGLFGMFFDGLRERSLDENGTKPPPFSTCHHNTKARKETDHFHFDDYKDFVFRINTWGTSVPSYLPKKWRRHVHKKEAAEKHGIEIKPQSEDSEKDKALGKTKKGGESVAESDVGPDATELQTIADLVNAIEGDKYVLDLDLDFFVTHLSSEEPLIDMQSKATYRKNMQKMCRDIVTEAEKYGDSGASEELGLALADLPSEQTWCKGVLDGYLMHIKTLRSSVRTDLSALLPLQIINRRVDSFLQLLKVLKEEHNKTPRMVTVSDSTSLLPFHRKKDEHYTPGGDQIPAEMVEHLRERVRVGLKKLFDIT